MAVKKKTGGARSAAKGSRPAAPSPTVGTARTGGNMASAPRSDKTMAVRSEVVAFFSEARKYWTVETAYLDITLPGKLFVGRLHCRLEDDWKVIRHYIDQNFPSWTLTRHEWAGIRLWIKNKASSFAGDIYYVEIGASEVVVRQQQHIADPT